MSGRSTRSEPLAVWPGLVAMAVLACGPADDRRTAAFSVSDSAGVTIAWSEAQAWGNAPGWSVSERPTLVIGADGDTDPAYALYGVGAVTRLSGGRIAVANRGTQQIRVYDAEGRHVRDIGRDGDGPGEFRGLAGIWPLTLREVGSDYLLGVVRDAHDVEHVVLHALER